MVLAFIPMLLIAIGYSELNRAEPDCGTTFTWATRAFGPYVGWLGGWGIIAADVIVMASLAQIAGQYGFLLFNADGIGSDPTSGWVLLVGVLWILVMAYVCYRGIEVSALSQKILLSIEVTMLAVFSAVALIKVGTGNAPAGHLTPHWSWFNPFDISSFSVFIAGILLMLFIYWGWDTAVAVNEETADRRRTPGRAAIISTFVLLAIYAVVTLAAQSFAGIGDKGIGLGNADNQGDVLSVLGNAVFGIVDCGLGVHPPADPDGAHLGSRVDADHDPADRADDAVDGVPTRRCRTPSRASHPRYLTPTFSTWAMGGASIVLYVALNFLSGGNVIADSVTALGLMIAFYYGLTGFACTWYFRKTLTKNTRDLWMQGILPSLGGVILFFAMGWSFWLDWKTTGDDENSYTTWLMPFSPHWRIGGVFIIGALHADRRRRADVHLAGDGAEVLPAARRCARASSSTRAATSSRRRPPEQVRLLADVGHHVLDARVVLEPVRRQVLAVPAVLEPAVRHLRDERDVGVDPDAAEVELLRHPHRPAVVTRPDARRQAVLHAVRPLERLAFVAELLHGDDRPEDLVLHDLVALLQPGDDGRLVEEPASPTRWPPVQHLRMRRQPVDEAGDPLELVRRC